MISVYIDWDKDGFSGFLDDVTDDVRPVQSQVSLSYGRGDSTALSAVAAGSGGFTLDNSSRKYSPFNTASPLYGKLKPSRPVWITRTVGDITYTLFRGHTDDNPINPDLSSQTASVGLVDDLADFRGFSLNTGVYRGLRTGEAIGKILDAVGWDEDLRDLDPGATLVPVWWESSDALSAVEKLVQSEGLPAYVSIGSDGEFIFRDRHHRLTYDASLTSQATWRGSGDVEPVMGVGFELDRAWSSIVNSASQSVDVRLPNTLGVVWSSEATISLLPGEQKIITASTTDPFYDAVAPVEGTDFVLRKGTVSVSLIRTSGTSTGIVLTANVGTAVIVQGLQLRAFSVPVGYSVNVSAESPDSKEEYRSRSLPNELPWAGPGDAQAICDLTVAQRDEPLARVTCRFMVGANDTRAAAVLSRNLSDRVTVVEPETGIDGDFFIEAIRHEFTSELDHVVIFDLEAAPMTLDGVFRFDVSGAGFDDGVFGNGLDDPANLFRFDGTSGHRFDEGVFAS